MTFPTFTKSKKFRIAAVFVLVVIVTGTTYGLYQFYKQAPDLSKVKPAFTLSSSELYTAFKTDEKAAGDKYTKKVVEVTGNVAQIEYGSVESNLNITLREDDQLSGVICEFRGIKDKSGINVTPGDQITIRGECSGMLMDVLLNNCIIVHK